jgi:hypothetical protein
MELFGYSSLWLLSSGIDFLLPFCFSLLTADVIEYFLFFGISKRTAEAVFQSFCGAYVIAVVPSHILMCLSFAHQYDLHTISYSLFTIRRSLIMILFHHTVSKLE